MTQPSVPADLPSGPPLVQPSAARVGGARNGYHAPQVWLPPAAALLVMAADYLFYGELIGWTLGGFAFAVLLVASVANRDLLRRPIAWIILILALGMCLAMVEEPSPLATGMFLVLLLTFLALGEGGVLRSALTWLLGLGGAAVQGAARAGGDVAALPGAVANVGGRGSLLSLLRAWSLPLIGGAIFLGLFSDANPLIGRWLSAIDPTRFLTQLPASERLVFWGFSAAGIWWLLRSRLVAAPAAQKPASPVQTPAGEVNGVLAWLFSGPAILRSLLVFNAMFAVQNGMDVAYLWGSGPLPPGFTYAAYAHRGAYPLMLTALLAAGFVLVAFRPTQQQGGAESEHHLGARALMYLWVGQNVVLVASSIWRMVLYVEAYSLTYTRVVALVWMALVALGLVLIVLRFLANRSNIWLVNTNVLALMAVLYAACFVNVGGLIADFNVRHCLEAGGRGVRLDLVYVEGIGPHALPAVRRFAEITGPDRTETPLTLQIGRLNARAQMARAKLEGEVNRRLQGWRGWTYRLHRLALNAA